MKSEPAFHAAMISLGVKAPGKTTTFCFTANSTTSRSIPGLLRNMAPASRQRRAVSVSTTVPAQFGPVARQFGNYLDGSGNRHRDFRDGNAAVCHRLHGKQSVLSRGKANRGKYPYLLYARPDGLLVHKPASFGAGAGGPGGAGTRVLRITISPNPTLRLSLWAACEFSLALWWPRSHHLRFSGPGKSEFTLPTWLLAVMSYRPSSGRCSIISPFSSVTWMSPNMPSMFTSPTPCLAISRAVRGALMRYSGSKGEKRRCRGASVVTTSSSPWRSAETRTLFSSCLALSRPPASYSVFVDLIVVISTSGRSHASTVSTPVDFVSRSVPPGGKSMRSVLLTCTCCLGSSAASSRQPAPNPGTANIRVVMRNLFVCAIT